MRQLISATASLLFVAIQAFAASLTRSEAQKVVNKHRDFREAQYVALDDTAFRKAKADGLWNSINGWWTPSAQGRVFFSSITPAAITLAKPLHRTVTVVTGIADGPLPGTKLVEYTWHFNDLTPYLAMYTGNTTANHEGSATLRHYDDGWRVIDLSVGNAQDGTNTRPLARQSEETVTGVVTGRDFLATDNGQRIAFSAAREGGCRFYGFGHIGETTWDIKVGDRLYIIGKVFKIKDEPSDVMWYKDARFGVFADEINILSRR